MTIKWLYHLSYDDCFPLVRCKMNSFYALREWRGRERREMTALSLSSSLLVALFIVSFLSAIAIEKCSCSLTRASFYSLHVTYATAFTLFKCIYFVVRAAPSHCIASTLLHSLLLPLPLCLSLPVLSFSS